MASALMIVLLVAGACAAAALLRQARVPGWPVAGGVLAGIVLGPTILGRAMPSVFESVFVGGVEERRTYDVQMLRDPGAAGDAETRLAAARQRHRRPLALVASFAAALVMLTVRGAGGEGPAPGAIAPLSIGAWAAAGPGAAVVAVMSWFWSAPWPAALLVASAVAVGPWRLGGRDRAISEGGELGGARLVEAAGGVATAIAIIAVAVALWHGDASVADAWPLAVAPVAWLAPAIGRRRLIELAQWMVIPVLGAATASRVDVIGGFALWPAVICLLAGADGRWLGALAGALFLGGRRGGNLMRLLLGVMACGPTQLAVLWVAMSSGLVDDPWLVALLLGAVFVEVSAPMRGATARMLEEGTS